MLFIAVIFLTAQSALSATYSCPSCKEIAVYDDYGSEEIYRISCLTDDKPYCNANSGSCNSIPPLACANTDSFLCTQDGVFPHPTDCQKFRICQNGTSYIMSCPSFSNFDYIQGTCVLGAPCYTISCSGKSGCKEPYHYAVAYAYCKEGQAIFLERCPGSYQLNTITQTCRPSCQAVGNKIPDAYDCTKYFYCSKEPFASDYTVTSVQCPQGQGFDPSFLRCEPLKKLPSCKPV